MTQGGDYGDTLCTHCPSPARYLTFAARSEWALDSRGSASSEPTLVSTFDCSKWVHDLLWPQVSLSFPNVHLN
jgi:hypothetical protein